MYIPNPMGFKVETHLPNKILQVNSEYLLVVY